MAFNGTQVKKFSISIRAGLEPSFVASPFQEAKQNLRSLILGIGVVAIKLGQQRCRQPNQLIGYSACGVD